MTECRQPNCGLLKAERERLGYRVSMRRLFDLVLDPTVYGLACAALFVLADFAFPQFTKFVVIGLRSGVSLWAWPQRTSSARLARRRLKINPGDVPAAQFRLMRSSMPPYASRSQLQCPFS
jgi:hypothetical protein